MFDLTKTSFLLPVRIESLDRYRNLLMVLRYITKNMNTNIIIAESDSISKVPAVIEQISGFGIGDKTVIKHIFYKTDEPLFHRMFLLNEMLQQATTPVVINYDCDILLPLDAYNQAQDMCLGEYDLVYPYAFGENTQLRVVLTDEVVDEFLKTSNLTCLNGFNWNSRFGFCQFFKTSAYLSGYAENENDFFAYSPDDEERHYRFDKLGYKIGRTNNRVYHQEHSRTHNSNSSSPFFKSSEAAFERIKTMSKEQLIKYYESQEYVKRRGWNK